MTAAMAFVYDNPEVEDLYRGQPLMQMRLKDILRVMRANGMPTTVPTGEQPPNHERTMSKDEAVPRLQMAISDGKIKAAKPRAVQPGAGSGVYVPGPAEAEAAFRGELAQATAFQLRAMLPREHELAKKMDAKKAELIEALVAVVRAA